MTRKQKPFTYLHDEISMTRKPKLLTRLRIDEVSSVDRGAGEGVRVVLMKHNRFTDAFRQVDFTKLRTNPPPVDETVDDGTDQGDIDTSSKLSPQLEQHVNAMLVAVPTLTRQQAVHWLLNTASGRALATHLNSISKRKEEPMDRAEGLRKIAKDYGVARLAKMLVMEGSAHGITEHELTGLAFEEAKKHARPGERPNTAFSRWYGEPEQLEFRKALQLAKSTPTLKSVAAPLMAFQPTTAEVGSSATADDSAEALEQLNAMANAMRAKSPTLTAAQCFARVFEDTANAELAAKAHRRPQATSGYAFPYETVG
jgi:hypothetical protein